jgi:WD40 repeat protein
LHPGSENQLDDHRRAHCTTFEQPGPAVSVAFRPDGRRIVTASADTSIRLWDSVTGELRATLITTRDGEWLTITPEGYFFASPGGNKVLAIVRGLEVFNIDQFYQILYRPDLVREKLAGDPNGKVKEAASKLDLAKLLDSGPVPRVAFTSHKAVETSTNGLLTVEASVTDQGGGIGRAEWRISIAIALHRVPDARGEARST